MTMREAFRASCLNYYQEIARRLGKQTLQFYLDTVQYGNKKIGNAADAFWVDNSLQISADEQVGFIKRLYFNELPFTERSQRIVRSMMVWEDTDRYKLSYKTGTGEVGNNYIYWIVGYCERIDNIKEHKNSMNKSNVRQYPYFFALNFEAPKGDTTHDYFDVRVKILHKILEDYGAMPTPSTP
jgi:beta-lactamase class D